ncbi:hydrogenase maturation nickel metallochaperone HypA [Chloroflexota bacterium]
MVYVEYTPKPDYNANRRMHELTVTEGVLAIALEKASAAKASRISRISLVIGELSGIVDECVQFYFDFLSKDTIAAETALSFRRLPVRLRCRSCYITFSPSNGEWACPACREQKMDIVSGRELYVDSIEVE